MTRLIRSRRALLSCLAALTVGSFLAVAAATGLGSGVATAPRAHRALAAAQAGTGGQDRPQSSGQRSLQASSSFSDWPMFMNSPAHSGLSAETTISTANAASLKQGWSAKLGTSSVVSPAVATSSTLGEAVLYAAANGTMSAYSAAKGGSPIWTFKLGTGGGNFQGSPDVFDGVLYDASDVGTVYALNAATGAKICSYTTGAAQIQASPVVVSDSDGSGPVLFIGSNPPYPAQGGEYEIYGAGNTHGQCTLGWKYVDTAFSSFGSWSPPAYATDANGNHLVVFGSRDPDDAVYALNATTGALDWRYQTSTVSEFDVGAGPTISAPGTNGFAGGMVYVAAKDKVVYALNLTTGKKIWSYKLVKTSTGASVSSGALDGDTFYVASNDGVYAINATTGALVWHVLTGNFYASPAITGPAGQQVLVIGNNAGRIYVLNLVTGATLWTKRPTTAGFWASTAISQGRIYAVSMDGELRIYKPAT